MTDISFKQRVFQALDPWEPFSWTAYAINQTEGFWQQPIAETTIIPPESKPPNEEVPTTPLRASTTPSMPDSSIINRFEKPDPSKPVPQEKEPPPVPSKAVSTRFIEACIRGVVAYILLPHLGHAGMLYNASFGGAKLVCAVLIYKTDKDAAHRLYKDCVMHGAMFVSDFAVSYFALIVAIGFTVYPSGCKMALEKLLKEYKTEYKVENDIRQDLRPIFERFCDYFIAWLTSSPESPWYHRLWSKVSFRGRTT
ncbi:MAG: hypothetical protein JSR58_03390 [Verrucomicrobia bacterium]|nr:hypothetical protein [Verrucomicrobiota bacterium]